MDASHARNPTSEEPPGPRAGFISGEICQERAFPPRARAARGKGIPWQFGPALAAARVFAYTKQKET